MAATGSPCMGSSAEAAELMTQLLVIAMVRRRETAARIDAVPEDAWTRPPMPGRVPHPRDPARNRPEAS